MSYSCLALQGRLDAVTAPQWEANVLALAESPKVMLDFRQLDYISSAGLRLVLMLAKRMQAKQGELQLCGLKPSVHQVFEMSGFLQILSVQATCEACD
ncbi:MAG: STAS domain-containing protein [Thiomicrospira sp.]